MNLVRRLASSLFILWNTGGVLWMLSHSTSAFAGGHEIYSFFRGDAASIYNQKKYGGPYYFRKTSGYWIQGGLSYVSANFPNYKLETSSLGPQTLGASRGGLGFWKNNWTLEGFFKTAVINLSPVKYNPNWVSVTGGRILELMQIFSVKILIEPKLGAEFYQNSIVYDNISFLKNNTSLLMGGRAHLLFGTHLDIGGEAFYGASTHIDKITISGDLKYWLTGGLVAVLTYSQDKAKERGGLFSENYSSVEIGLRIIP